MMMKTKNWNLIVLAFLTAASAFAFTSNRKAAAPATQPPAVGQTGTVWIAKPDGAQMCAPKSGKAIEAGAQELDAAKIRILGSKKGNDGKMHAQVCGIPSGSTNMYEISSDDVARATELGFRLVQ